ncbi:MipA/OmpV family protein [Pontixanthobacter aestiaquae]|uniref:MipA/OmpV family protein n=1 Tax=Pontixanthobacter aestiaquae TaxID=1509367 RepID=A0A844Z1N3_9SPHN|nr:MipA/OmpV family protein [Pontixanthobacter aestiaquae]MDN3646380.1 MipA/OmpV family protein [Pontixanthobacter aestiaquae]MXO82631.1 MipA/OmpV family protein [Pontixanthobacter aestiaquae]
MTHRILTGLASSALALIAVPASAQTSEAPVGPPVGPPEGVEAGPGGPPDSVFDDTWINIGFGVAYSPSYTGSDDYVFNPLPVVQGSVAGVDISPRPAGLALDFIPDTDDGPNITFGPAIRLRNDRADQIEDPVVELAGELDRAVEVGAATGISFPKLLNPFDSLTMGADIRWDVAGAHGGMVIDPSITYSTPVNRGTFVSLSLGTEYASDDFADYYYSVNTAQSAASGLPQFTADGGFTRVSATTLVGVDLDGNALNGGLNAVVIGGYSRLIDDAKNNPYTAIRGTADQFFVGVGLGYTF